MVSANHWLRGIKTYWLSWYLSRASANHASSNWAQVSKMTNFSLGVLNPLVLLCGCLLYQNDQVFPALFYTSTREIPCRPLRNSNVKRSNLRFCGEREHTTVNFSFSSSNLNATVTNLVPG